MTGLDKILKRIEEDASVAAEAVISQANKEATIIHNGGQVEAKKIVEDFAEKSRLEVDDCISRAKSAAILQEKKLILDTKQQIITDTITRAKESLLLLSNQEYFEVIKKMVQKYALCLSGEIFFSVKDKKRVPEQFETTLQSLLSGKEGAALTVSEQTVDIDGGFVLVYGDIEENCSFDALFAAAKETLQDKVNALLFD